MLEEKISKILEEFDEEFVSRTPKGNDTMLLDWKNMRPVHPSEIKQFLSSSLRKIAEKKG